LILIRSTCSECTQSSFKLIIDKYSLVPVRFGNVGFDSLVLDGELVDKFFLFDTQIKVEDWKRSRAAKKEMDNGFSDPLFLVSIWTMGY
jgi:hypothetical protein